MGRERWRRGGGKKTVQEDIFNLVEFSLCLHGFCLGGREGEGRG